MRVRAATRVVACPAPHISRKSPNGWRLSGERSGAERVRCSRGFGESLLMSRNMPGRYASADALFNGPEPIFAENR